MALDTNLDIMIRLYFGQDGSTRPTKEEVATFITDEMGLTDDGNSLRDSPAFVSFSFRT